MSFRTNWKATLKFLACLQLINKHLNIKITFWHSNQLWTFPFESCFLKPAQAYNTLYFQNLSWSNSPLCWCSPVQPFTEFARRPGIFSTVLSSPWFHQPSASFLVNCLGGRDYQLKKGGTINGPPDHLLHLLWLHLLSANMASCQTRAPGHKSHSTSCQDNIFTTSFVRWRWPSISDQSRPTATAHFGKTAKSIQAYLNPF